MLSKTASLFGRARIQQRRIEGRSENILTVRARGDMALNALNMEGKHMRTPPSSLNGK